MFVTAATALSSFPRLASPFAATLRLCSSSPPFLPPPPSFSSRPAHRVPCRQPKYKQPSFVPQAAESISQGFWKEPDDGYCSEENELDGEEEEMEKEQNEGVSNGASTASGFNSDYEQLEKEVELMLEPAERAILQQNEIPDFSKVSTLKWSLFHSLGLSLQIPLMDKLLEYGWDIDSVDKAGFTALHKAVIGKKEAVISHLLRKGANPHVRDQDGATALHYAVQAGAMQTVKLLIKYKVDVNVADKNGWTPLHISMQCRSKDIAKVLLVNGADKTRRNKDGQTALDLSLCYGRDFKSYDLAKLLKLVPENRDT